jgi:hypothetical protein
VDSQTRLHAELLGLFRQHSQCVDQRHLVLLAWMVAGLLLSQTVCFDRWKAVLPLGHCLAASWQRRAQRWLSNSRIEVEALYGPLVLWALQHWQTPGQALHLALDTTMLWNRCCVVVLSVVCHGRAVPLLWRTLEHPSASVSAEVSIALLDRADALLAEFGAITLLADRAFPSAELLGWFEEKPRWRYVMRLRADTWIHGTAAPMGCEVRRLRLPRGHCRGFRNVHLWAVSDDNEVGRSATSSLAGWVSAGVPGAYAQGPGDAGTTDESPTQPVHGETTRPQQPGGCGGGGGHFSAQCPPD